MRFLDASKGLFNFFVSAENLAKGAPATFPEAVYQRIAFIPTLALLRGQSGSNQGRD